MNFAQKIAFSLIAFAVVFSGCSKAPPRFEDARIDMALEDFKANHPHAQGGAEVKGPTGIPFSIYRRENEGRIKNADYFFSEGKLVGIVVVYSAEAPFDSVVEILARSNGNPTRQLMMEHSKIAAWERGIYFMNMVQSDVETSINLPTGTTRPLQPRDIVIMLGKKGKAK